MHENVLFPFRSSLLCLLSLGTVTPSELLLRRSTGACMFMLSGGECFPPLMQRVESAAGKSNLSAPGRWADIDQASRTSSLNSEETSLALLVNSPVIRLEACYRSVSVLTEYHTFRRTFVCFVAYEGCIWFIDIHTYTDAGLPRRVNVALRFHSNLQQTAWNTNFSIC